MKSLVLWVALIPHFSYAADCIRRDQNKVEALEGVVSATIKRRYHDFDARVRFLNRSQEQVDTCSTHLGNKNKFNCWTRAGIIGEADRVSFQLVVNLKRSRDRLSEIKRAFEMTVKPVDESKSATFQCD